MDEKFKNVVQGNISNVGTVIIGDHNTFIKSDPQLGDNTSLGGKTFKIFLASSGTLSEERTAINTFIAAENKKLHEKGLFLHLVIWEELLKSFRGERIQDYFNREMLACDMVIALFFDKAGEFTLEEFEKAFAALKEGKNPRYLYVYFKDAPVVVKKDTWSELKKIGDLKERIEKEKQIYCMYTTTDNLLRQIRDQLDMIIEQAMSSTQKETNLTIVSKKDQSVNTDITAYLRWIEDRCTQMDLQQLASEPIIVGLPELFVPLYANDPDYAKALRNGKLQDPDDASSKSTIPVDIEELVARNPYLLIEGDPGCGKTTLLKQIALKMTRNTTPDDMHLPVLVFLRDCIAQFKENGSHKFSADKILETYFEYHENMLSCDAVKEFCKTKKVLFLIDGLDEAPEASRSGIIEAFAEFGVKYNVRMVLAGRKHGIVGTAMQWFGKKHVKVLPFNNEQIELFVRKWCDIIYVKRAREGKKTADELIHELQSHNAVQVLIENPLLLTTVCILYYEGEKLPEQRAELYRKFVENLIHRRFDEPDRILEVLKGLAFQMQVSGEKGIGKNDALAVVKQSYQQNKEESVQDYSRRINRLFEEFEPHSGLLRLEGGHYRFWHLTFQEYLAAEYLIASSEDLVRAIEPYLTHDQFKETVRLYIGCLSLNQKMVAATIIRNVLQRNDASIDELILVGEALVDIKKERRDDRLVTEIQERYWKEINSDRVKRNKKAALGEIIGWVGDERDLCLFVDVRGGQYDFSREKKISISNFKICVYPVTNGWYAEFIKDNGYQDSTYWSEAGWKWRTINDVRVPSHWENRRYNCPSFPVVGVSWYEAEAFVNWLNTTKPLHKTGKYKLPTEDEWQAAAEGPTKRRYPWGHEYEIGRCNCNDDEESIKSVSIVGLFHLGDSPEGVADMSGNVWEWIEKSYEDKKIICGGSWSSFPQSCVTYYSRKAILSYRFDDVGFRVVLVP